MAGRRAAQFSAADELPVSLRLRGIMRSISHLGPERQGGVHLNTMHIPKNVDDRPCTKSSVSFDLTGPEREACGEPSVVIETYNVGPAVEVLMDRPLRTGQQAKGAFGFSAGYGDCGTGARLVRSS
jgi:hypothetical protein